MSKTDYTKGNNSVSSSHCPISTADLLRQELGNTVSRLNRVWYLFYACQWAKNECIFKLLKKKEEDYLMTRKRIGIVHNKVFMATFVLNHRASGCTRDTHSPRAESLSALHRWRCPLQMKSLGWDLGYPVPICSTT